MLGRLGIRIDPHDVRVRNVAAVMVTAQACLPSRARGPAWTSASPRWATPARWRGASCWSRRSRARTVRSTVWRRGRFRRAASTSPPSGPPSRRISRPRVGFRPGATVERAVTPNLEKDVLTLGLKRPDFTTANNLAEAINKSLGEEAAKAIDPAAIDIKVPAAYKGKSVSLMTKLETPGGRGGRAGARGDQRAHRHGGGGRAGPHPSRLRRAWRNIHLGAGHAGGGPAQRVLPGEDRTGQAGPDRCEGKGEAGHCLARHLHGRAV
jgi:hypothetical protein